MTNLIHDNELSSSIVFGLEVILTIALVIALIVPPEWLGFGF